ncbi:MAG: peptidoglycan-binding domain-containing protein [Streptosporangiaceae bacterium]|jgi:peptidoglycan hydrolase-like protein with peptidoglycan-binding domain|nr:hypothetical protein [Actinomycetota bacterium]
MRLSLRRISIGVAGLAMAGTMPALVATGTASAATATASARSASSPAALSWPTVSYGARGERVYAIQYLLRARGYRIGTDGTFGSVTRADVRNFQHVRGLAADGVVGSATWNRLIIQVRFGNRGSAVAALQHNLRYGYGYRNLPVTGYFGSITRGDVRNFQSRHGLAADGTVGPLTWNALIRGES